MASGVFLAAEQIPSELKLLERWVCWRYEVRGDKRTKVPYTADNTRAKVTDPSDWMLFDAALVTLHESQERALPYVGIGFVLVRADGLVAFDFDHCLNKKGDITDAKVSEAVARLSSYTEVTPSGEGLRVLCYGSLPRGANRRAGYEIYDDKRYVTLTGNKYPGSADSIEIREESIKAVWKALLGSVDVAQGLAAALQKKEIADLYEADTDAKREALGHGSHSDADLALCRMLLPFGSTAEVDAWFRASKLMRPKWEREDYRQRTLTKAQELATKDSQHLTDLGNAKRYEDIAAGSARWCGDEASWYTFEGDCFKKDNLPSVSRIGESVIQDFYDEALKQQDADKRKVLFTHAAKLESRSRFDSMLSMAKARAGVFISSAALDARPLLINCKNGTVEILVNDEKQPFNFREHRADDLITRVTGAEYNPDARCPQWLAFISQVTVQRQGLATFLQQMAGYSITGLTSEQKLFYLYGGGNNGKTTFVKTIELVMGNYAGPLATETLLLNKQDPHPTGLTDLKGLNLAVVSELPQKRRLNEDLAKRITGGETIKARRMRQDFFSFENHAKLWIYGNEKLSISGTDRGIWRRVLMIPFDAQFPQTAIEGRIGNYWEQLYEQESSGILNWILQGYESWAALGGLTLPSEVESATERYRDEQDLVGRFLEECVAVNEQGDGVYTEVVYTRYKKWCEDNGERYGSSRELVEKIKQKGFPIVAGNANKKRFLGFELIADDEQHGSM